MKIISYDAMKNLNIDYSSFYKWASEVIKDKKNAILPPKISMKMDGHIFFNVMPSVLYGIDSSGVKMVTRFPERIPALDGDILLYDSKKGDLLALMDGLYITAMRTGAIAALAITTLAIKDYQTIAFMGLGNTARATLLILLSQINQKKLHIKLLAYKGQEKLFIERFKKYKNIEFEVVESYENLICNSDVIVSCVTYADINFGKNEWFKEGCLVVPVHTMGFLNCDLFFDKIIVDDMGHVNTFKNFDKFKYCVELSDVINNTFDGRTNNEERILAYNIGVSIEDVYFAKKIYDMLEKNISDIENYKKPENKFWV